MHWVLQGLLRCQGPTSVRPCQVDRYRDLDDGPVDSTGFGRPSRSDSVPRPQEVSSYGSPVPIAIVMLATSGSAECEPEPGE
jgi:hypothetical protein